VSRAAGDRDDRDRGYRAGSDQAEDLGAAALANRPPPSVTTGAKSLVVHLDRGLSGPRATRAYARRG
jgi:hypothetical protein